ncbi:pollen-specific leucine-rich repeat extensin-like protein 4 [Iris pallida]|uniref:Pollen-specific leucine-rich repeat extensin-like protein 4 n=1 Tax=Iris pallida TaxID=29817 RepID=A0AAX6E528_IRIPA|nr:pollen-specific leucine-rich repeat extensin-like protein 4 [Iris pallida]
MKKEGAETWGVTRTEVDAWSREGRRMLSTTFHGGAVDDVPCGWLSATAALGDVEAKRGGRSRIVQVRCPGLPHPGEPTQGRRWDGGFTGRLRCGWPRAAATPGR